MTTVSNNPAYTNNPVILVHVVVLPKDGIGPPMAWCAPYEYKNPLVEDWPNIPRQMCPACIKAGR